MEEDFENNDSIINNFQQDIKNSQDNFLNKNRMVTLKKKTNSKMTHFNT